MSTRPIAVFDIDGTLFRWQLYYEVVLRLIEGKLIDERDATSVLAEYQRWQSRTGSFADFELVAIEALNRALPGLKHADFDKIIADVLEDSSHRVYSYTRALAEELKTKGYFLLAISGSMQEVAEPFAVRYGFDDCIGWLYERRGDTFTGKTLRKTVGNKAALLKGYADAGGFDLKNCVAVGDSRGDIDMLRLAGRPIAFNPSIELLDEARSAGWEIVVERKNIAYSLRKGQDGTFLLATADVV